MTNEEYLAKVPLFSHMGKEDLKRIGRVALKQRFKKGEVIVREGNPGLAFYLIISGRVKVSRGLDEEKRVLLGSLGPGEFFGEMALLDHYPRSASVVAERDTECLLLSQTDFLLELRRDPEMALQLLPVLSRRLREVEKRISE